MPVARSAMGLLCLGSWLNALAAQESTTFPHLKNCTKISCKPSCNSGKADMLPQRVCKMCKCRKCKACAAVLRPTIHSAMGVPQHPAQHLRAAVREVAKSAAKHLSKKQTKTKRQQKEMTTDVGAHIDAKKESSDDVAAVETLAKKKRKRKGRGSKAEIRQKKRRMRRQSSASMTNATLNATDTLESAGPGLTGLLHGAAAGLLAVSLLGIFIVVANVVWKTTRRDHLGRTMIETDDPSTPMMAALPSPQGSDPDSPTLSPSVGTRGNRERSPKRSPKLMSI